MTPDTSPRTPPDRTDETLRIGELAARSGVTVRMLHHYDRIGLLQPSQRSTGGHRVYAGADLLRLEIIVGLRTLGFSLEDIGEVLDDGSSAVALVDAQLAAVEESLGALRRVRARLGALAAALERGADPAGAEVLELARLFGRADRPMTAAQFREAVRSRAERLASLEPAERAELVRRRHEAMAALDEDARGALREQQGRRRPSGPGRP